MNVFEPAYPVTHELIGKCAMRCFISEGSENVSYADFQSNDPEVEGKIIIWGAIENYEFSGAQGLASDLASDIEDTVHAVLKAVKAQIVADTIEGTFPSDANDIDMNHLLESGLKLKAME